ncbi:hypothetical protein LTR53_019935, partial [Teratosphaeriaceae sp. CCFEE 6253]
HLLEHRQADLLVVERSGAVGALRVAVDARHVHAGQCEETVHEQGLRVRGYGHDVLPDVRRFRGGEELECSHGGEAVHEQHVQAIVEVIWIVTRRVGAR